MIGARVHITGVLTVLSPLHIGSGSTFELQREGGTSDVFEVQTDKDCKPWIPGSSIKGVLRRLGGNDADIFGPKEIKVPKDAASGKVIFRGATWRSAGPAHGRVPHKDKKPGRFIDSRTAIDGASGTADDGKLFNTEYVLPGATFDFELVVDAGLPEAARIKLREILGQLCAADGVAFGKNTKHGNGRLRLEETSLAPTKLTFRGDSGTNVKDDWTPIKAGPAGTLKTLTLTATGPFLIGDSSAPKREGANDATAHVGGLRDLGTENLPRLTGSTLLGALREKCAWLERAQGGAADDKDRVCKKGDEGSLTKTQRLFGVTGWKGRVQVEKITPEGDPAKQTIMSVKIDRFSGAPMDGALFGTEAWSGVGFRAGLHLDPRGATVDDDALFAKLLDELADKVWGGLDLGHGVNKGYGRFEVSIK